MTSPQDILRLYSDMLSAANRATAPSLYRVQWPSLSELAELLVMAGIVTAGLMAFVLQIS